MTVKERERCLNNLQTHIDNINKQFSGGSEVSCVYDFIEDDLLALELPNITPRAVQVQESTLRLDRLQNDILHVFASSGKKNNDDDDVPDQIPITNNGKVIYKVDNDL